MNEGKDKGSLAKSSKKKPFKQFMDLVRSESPLFVELIKESSRVRISRGMGNHFKERVDEVKNL